MKTTSIMTVAKHKFSETGEKGLTLLLGAVIVLLLAGLVIPVAAFSQGSGQAGVIPVPHRTVQPPEMIPPGVVPHKIHVDVPTIGLRYTSQATKTVTLSQDRRHPRHHNNSGSAASSAAAGGGGSAASSAAAGGGRGSGSAASSAAAGGGGGSGSAASSAAAGGGGDGGGSAASSAAAGG